MPADTSAYAGPPRPPRAEAGPVAAAVLTALGLLAAVWPLTAVVQPGSWSSGTATTGAAVILTGAVVRLPGRRAPAWVAIPAVPVMQLIVGAVALTVFAGRQLGRGWLLPTPELSRAVDALVSAAVREIQGGVAPLASSAALAVSIAAAAGLIAVVLDLVLVPLRAPIIAAVLVTALGAVPAIIVHHGLDPVWFVGLAVVILLFLRVRFTPTGTGWSAPPADDGSVPRRTKTPGDTPVRTRRLPAVVIGALAVVGALVVTPLLPLSASGISAGSGTATLSATLNLGQDLRRPSPVTALTLITQDGTPPYLRIATLSRFDGSTWQPDHPSTVPLAQGFGEVAAPPGVAVHATRTTIRTAGIAGSWLPVPYQATAVRGEVGSWSAAADNRTVIAANADAAGQNYTIDTKSLVPTVGQIRAATSTGADAPAELRALPADMPAIISEEARQVVGGATTDYDKLIALQTWFRAGFRYSLQTPVDDRFDGTNVEAVAKFLSVREGYCVHFAGAFALMARSLGMPTRIVVGYLPGTATDRRSDDGRVVFEVSTDQLHSWPEVYFSGLGWVPFDPTATRGVPTAFAESSGTSGNTGATPSAGPTPAPTSSGNAKDPKNLDVPDAGAAGAAGPRPLATAPVLWTVAGVLAVLLIPALVRRAQRLRRRTAAARGDAVAAWAELRATLQDLGLPAPPSESPRARGERLVRERGVDPEAADALVRAIERSSYAPPGSGTAAREDLRAPLDALRRELRETVSRRDRLAAAFTPRSLLGARLLAASAS